MISFLILPVNLNIVFLLSIDSMIVLVRDHFCLLKYVYSKKKHTINEEFNRIQAFSRNTIILFLILFEKHFDKQID